MNANLIHAKTMAPAVISHPAMFATAHLDTVDLSASTLKADFVFLYEMALICRARRVDNQLPSPYVYVVAYRLDDSYASRATYA
jgi:hypothetical protein